MLKTWLQIALSAGTICADSCNEVPTDITKVLERRRLRNLGGSIQLFIGWICGAVVNCMCFFGHAPLGGMEESWRMGTGWLESWGFWSRQL